MLTTAKIVFKAEYYPCFEHVHVFYFIFFERVGVFWPFEC